MGRWFSVRGSFKTPGARPSWLPVLRARWQRSQVFMQLLRRPCFWGCAAALLIWTPLSSRAADVEPVPKYEAAVRVLIPFIEHEVSEKRLPALSIALVDDQEIVWAKGFGFANPQAKIPATADTVYRVGSVSKLFTDVAVMQLEAQGRLDLYTTDTSYIHAVLPVITKHKPN